MEADYILLCNKIQISKEMKEIDGGVVIKGTEIVCIGKRREIAEYVGIDTNVIEFGNGYLISFRTNDETTEDYKIANIAVFAAGRRRAKEETIKMSNLRFMMYRGECIFEKVR